MPMRRRLTRGMSLIELMVTVALMAFLLLVSLPLTKAWVDSAKQREAADVLAEGLGRAKALAMRNPAGIEDAAKPSAFVCLSASTVAVARIDLSGACGKGQLAWTGTIPGQVAVKLPDHSGFQCVAYNARGLTLSASVASVPCTTISPEVHLGQEDAFTVALP